MLCGLHRGTHLLLRKSRYVGAIILPISQVRKSGQRGKGSCPELHSEFVVKPEKVELEAR